MKNGRTKPYREMTTEELREATKEYDAPHEGEELPGRPLTAEQRKLWEKAKARGRGRPKVGKGAEVISVSIERDLLAATDAAARSEGISRAALIARGLRAVLPATRGRWKRS